MSCGTAWTEYYTSVYPCNLHMQPNMNKRNYRTLIKHYLRKVSLKKQYPPRKMNCVSSGGHSTFANRLQLSDLSGSTSQQGPLRLISGPRFPFIFSYFINSIVISALSGKNAWSLEESFALLSRPIWSCYIPELSACCCVLYQSPTTAQVKQACRKWDFAVTMQNDASRITPVQSSYVLRYRRLPLVSEHTCFVSRETCLMLQSHRVPKVISLSVSSLSLQLLTLPSVISWNLFLRGSELPVAFRLVLWRAFRDLLGDWFILRRKKVLFSIQVFWQKILHQRLSFRQPAESISDLVKY